jgi:hypothetical protein
MESALEYLPKLIEKLIVRLKKASAPGAESDSYIRPPAWPMAR